MRTRKKPDPPPPDVSVPNQPATSTVSPSEEPTAATPVPEARKPRRRGQAAPPVTPVPPAPTDLIERTSAAPETAPVVLAAEATPVNPPVADGPSAEGEIPPFLRTRPARRAPPPPIRILGEDPAARPSSAPSPPAPTADPLHAPAAKPKYRVYVLGERVADAATDKGTASGLAYYVGRTGNLPRRITQHLNAAINGDPHPRSVWLRGLIATQQRPVVQTVATCRTEAEAAEAEAHWIRTLRGAGHPLTNAFLPDEPQAERVVNPAHLTAPPLAAQPANPPVMRPPIRMDPPSGALSAVPTAGSRRHGGGSWVLGGLTVALLVGLVGAVLLGPTMLQRLAPARPPRITSQVVPTPDQPVVPPALTATSLPIPVPVGGEPAAVLPAGPTVPPPSVLSGPSTSPPSAAPITAQWTPNPAVPSPAWTTEDTASAIPPAQLDPPPPPAAFQQNTTYAVPAGTRLIHLGETWASAADAVGITVAELQAANPDHPIGAPLFAGEVINFPLARGGGP